MEERLQKIIAHAGIASRRKAEELILEGKVTVNGKVVTELGRKADPEKDHIKVNRKMIRPEALEYYAVNKPSSLILNPLSIPAAEMSTFKPSLAPHTTPLPSFYYTHRS